MPEAGSGDYSPDGARLAYVGLQMPVNAAVGLAIYFAPTVLYPHYATIVRSWGPSALIDQQIGGVHATTYLSSHGSVKDERPERKMLIEQ